MTTEEGVLVFKLFKIVKTAPYELKLSHYQDGLNGAISLISDADFKTYLVHTYHIYDKIPHDIIMKSTLNDISSVVNAQLGNASTAYQLLIENMNKLTPTPWYKNPWIVGTIIISVAGTGFLLWYIWSADIHSLGELFKRSSQIQETVIRQTNQDTAFAFNAQAQHLIEFRSLVNEVRRLVNMVENLTNENMALKEAICNLYENILPKLIANTDNPIAILFDRNLLISSLTEVTAKKLGLSEVYHIQLNQ
jgi:hypothetical protein